MQNASSLVKYHTPILVNTTGTKNIKKGAKKAGNGDKQTTQTEDILNSILPPRFVIGTSFYHYPAFPSICCFVCLFQFIQWLFYIFIVLFCCTVSYCNVLCCIVLHWIMLHHLVWMWLISLYSVEEESFVEQSYRRFFYDDFSSLRSFIIWLNIKFHQQHYFILNFYSTLLPLDHMITI